MIIRLHDTVINLNNVVLISPHCQSDYPLSDGYVQQFIIHQNGVDAPIKITYRNAIYKTTNEAISAAQSVLNASLLK